MRRPLPRGRRLHRAPDSTRLPRGDLRPDGGRRASPRSWSSARSPASSRPGPPRTPRCCARARTTTWRRSRPAGTARAWRTWTSRPASFASRSWRRRKRRQPSSSWAPRRCWWRDGSPAGAGLQRAAHRGRRLGLRSRLRRAHPARALRPAYARRLRPGRAQPGGRRGGRRPALSQGHAEGRAEPSRAAHLLRPRRGDGARHRHRAQPRTGRAAVHRRRRRQGIDAGQS